MKLEKIEYTLKAVVAGAGLGLAVLGALTYIPNVSFTLPQIGTVAACSGVGLALCTVIFDWE